MAGSALAPAAPPDPDAPVLPPLSPVILAENPDAVQRFAVNGQMARQMVDAALLTLTSAPDIGTAWKRLGVTPQDVVGIKITTMGGPLLSTHHALVQAICEGLEQAGLSPSRMIIWDKSRDDMIEAGYTPIRPDDSHVGIVSLFPGVGYDTSVVYKNEIIGTLIWGDTDFIHNSSNADLFDAARAAVNDDPTYGPKPDSTNALTGPAAPPQTSTRSYYAVPLTRLCTKIINVPVLTDNSGIGMEGCLGSLALGAVDNNRRFQNDPTYGDPAICEILDKEFMRKKVIVHILDSLIAEYAGGPEFNPQFTQQIGAIYVSRDPVAIDSLVLPLLEKWRKANNVDPIGKAAAHIHDAANYNLGTDDKHRIQLVRVP